MPRLAVLSLSTIEPCTGTIVTLRDYKKRDVDEWNSVGTSTQDDQLLLVDGNYDRLNTLPMFGILVILPRKKSRA